VSEIVEIPVARLRSGSWSVADQATALAQLEDSNVLFIPGLGIDIRPDERLLFNEGAALIDGVQKNITLDPLCKRTSGVVNGSPLRATVDQLMERYRDSVEEWLQLLFGTHGTQFRAQRTTFRPVEIKNRGKIGKASASAQFRYDDTLLHTDAFKVRPMVNRRILRVFNNINPHGEPRLWKVGGDFSAYAKRYVDKIRKPLPGEFTALQLLRLTRWRRSLYDHIMLNLHDMGKADGEFQATSPQKLFEFPPNSVWLCFTDSVLHAALQGRYALEQTFEITVEDMADPAKSPQRRLEALMGQAVY
jgi:3-deoxy-D-manno-oct-2-ulosonic acid (Kdo) hydroxylase